MLLKRKVPNLIFLTNELYMKSTGVTNKEKYWKKLEIAYSKCITGHRSCLRNTVSREGVRPLRLA